LLIYNRRHDIHQLFTTDGVIHNILQCQTPLSKGSPSTLVWSIWKRYNINDQGKNHETPLRNFMNILELFIIHYLTMQHIDWEHIPTINDHLNKDFVTTRFVIGAIFWAYIQFANILTWVLFMAPITFGNSHQFFKSNIIICIFPICHNINILKTMLITMTTSWITTLIVDCLMTNNLLHICNDVHTRCKLENGRWNLSFDNHKLFTICAKSFAYKYQRVFHLEMFNPFIVVVLSIGND